VAGKTLMLVTETPDIAATAPVGPARQVAYASVLVPLDGTDTAERALAPAAALATSFGADLHVVAAGIRHDERWWYEGYLERLRDRVSEVVGHVSSDRDIAAGILSTAREIAPCLVCMSTHGRSRTAAVVGSTFAGVAALIGAPLVAVGPRVVSPPPGPMAIDHLLVCLDGCVIAERALPVATGWARRFGPDISLVTTADPLLVRGALGRQRAVGTRHYPPDGDPQAYLDALRPLPLFDGLNVRTQVLWGMAEPSIIIGQHLDTRLTTIAVATTHARTGLARAALGSTVARIVHRSPVPVLVVPPDRGGRP
jgi:nucleotide-binding universal stress UspA family protein